MARAMELPEDHKVSWLSLHDALTSMQAHDKPIPKGAPVEMPGGRRKRRGMCGCLERGTPGRNRVPGKALTGAPLPPNLQPHPGAGIKARPDLLLKVDKLAVEGFLHVVAPPATTGKQELVLRLGMGRLLMMLAQVRAGGFDWQDDSRWGRGFLRSAPPAT